MAVYRTNDGLVTFTLGPDTPEGLEVREKSVSVAPPATVAPAPTLWTKAKRLRIELIAWRKAGYRLADRPTRAHRTAICNVCQHYAPAGNWGLGECRAPGCGCTRAKLWLASAKCPLNPPKWGTVEAAVGSAAPL